MPIQTVASPVVEVHGVLLLNLKNAKSGALYQLRFEILFEVWNTHDPHAFLFTRSLMKVIHVPLALHSVLPGRGFPGYSKW